MPVRYYFTLQSSLHTIPREVVMRRFMLLVAPSHLVGSLSRLRRSAPTDRGAADAAGTNDRQRDRDPAAGAPRETAGRGCTQARHRCAIPTVSPTHGPQAIET